MLMLVKKTNRIDRELIHATDQKHTETWSFHRRLCLKDMVFPGMSMEDRTVQWEFGVFLIRSPEDHIAALARGRVKNPWL